MSIKPDVWIKRMAESEGMIKPFSENQVRVDDKGEKPVSYTHLTLPTILRV